MGKSITSSSWCLRNPDFFLNTLQTQKCSFPFILWWKGIESLMKSQIQLPLKWICSWWWGNTHKVPQLWLTLDYIAHMETEVGEKDLLDMLDRLHQQMIFILFHDLGSLPCRLATKKTISMPFYAVKSVCTPTWLKESALLWLKGVLEQLPLHILFAHCLEGNSCGQHPDTIPCCAVQSSFKIALLCRREQGPCPQPFPRLLMLCYVLSELLCPRRNGGPSSPFYQKMGASGKRSVLLCLASYCHHQSYEVGKPTGQCYERAVGWFFRSTES